MNSEMGLKLQIIALVMEYDIDDFLGAAQEIFNWIIESREKEVDRSHLSPVN